MRSGALAGREDGGLPVPALDRLLLRAAILPGEAGRRGLHAWRVGGGSVDDVGPAAFALLPLLYRNLETDGADDPELPVLAGVYRHAFVRRERLVAGAAAALGTLSAARPLLLGGAAVGAAHYPDPTCRPLAAVDVLVGRGAAGGGGLVLHRRVPRLGGAERAVRAAAVPVVLGGAAATAPGATDQLLHACARAMTSAGERVQALADAAIVLRDARQTPDWSRIETVAVQRGAAVGVRLVLRLLRDDLDAPVPDDVLTVLDHRRHSWRARVGGLHRPR